MIKWRLPLLLLLLIALAAVAPAQVTRNPITIVTSDPAGGACGPSQVFLFVPGGGLYTCVVGTITLTTGGGGGVAQVDIEGTATEIEVSGTCSIITTGTCTIGIVTNPAISGANFSNIPTAAINNNAITLAKLATQADQTILANISGGVDEPTAASLTGILDDILGTTQGSVIYRNGTVWTVLTPGVDGQFLKTGGAGANISWDSPAGAGTVTDVSWTGGIVSIATSTSTPAFTIAGTSGGIPYFSNGTTWASSAALSANLPIFGGGAGAAPFSGTRTGNTTLVATSTGAQTSGRCVEIDASGNHVAAAAACGGGGDVVGPASATDGAIAVYDTTTGKLLKNSQVTIDTTAGRAGGIQMPQGTAATPAANTAVWQAPASVTAYDVLVPASAGATGVLKAAVSGTTVTTSFGQIVNAEITNGTIDLTTKVTGILPSANGGTNNAFFTVSGPATSAKTFTFPNANATIPQTIATGDIALDTDAIASEACDTMTDTATGTATTDVIDVSFNGDPTGVTGYVPSTDGMLTIIVYPTSNTVNVKVCNNTAGSITPGAITLNWAVRR